MARAKDTDLLHAFPFRVTDTEGFLDTVSGFTTATLPEKTISTVEYREAMRDLLPRKFPGLPEAIPDVTLTRGVAKTDTEFFDWLRDAYEGRADYRTDLQIQHYHKPSDDSPTIVYQLFEAFPIRVNPGSDFDADDESISIIELDLAVEEIKQEHV